MSEELSINEASSNKSRSGSIVPSPTKQESLEESKPEPDSDPMEASTSTGGSTSTDGSGGGASKTKKKKKLRIKILEKKLKILDKHIKKYMCCCCVLLNTPLGPFNRPRFREKNDTFLPTFPYAVKPLFNVTLQMYDTWQLFP